MLADLEDQRRDVQPAAGDHPQPQRADPVPAPPGGHHGPPPRSRPPSGSSGTAVVRPGRSTSASTRSTAPSGSSTCTVSRSSSPSTHRTGSSGDADGERGRQGRAVAAAASSTSGTAARASSSPCAVTTAPRTVSAATRREPAQPRGRGEPQRQRRAGHRGAGTDARTSATTSAPVTRRTHSSGRRLSRWASAADRDRLDVLGRHVVAAVEHRLPAGQGDEREPAARARPDGHLGVLPGRVDQRDDVGQDRRLHRHPVQARPHRQHGPVVDHRPQGRRRPGLLDPSAQQLLLVRDVEVAQRHPQQEAVELGLRQGVRPLVLDRVVRREHDEGPGERPGLAVAGHLLLGHRLEQRRLGLGWRPVDLVGQQQLGEHRPRPELEAARRRVVDREPGQVGRQQVRGELHPREGQAERLREGPRHHRLAEPGHVLEQHVPAAEDAEQDQLERPAPADDDALQLVEDPAGQLGGADRAQRLDLPRGLAGLGQSAGRSAEGSQVLQAVDDAGQGLGPDAGRLAVAGRLAGRVDPGPDVLAEHRPGARPGRTRGRPGAGRPAGPPPAGSAAGGSPRRSAAATRRPTTAARRPGGRPGRARCPPPGRVAAGAATVPHRAAAGRARGRRSPARTETDTSRPAAPAAAVPATTTRAPSVTSSRARVPRPSSSLSSSSSSARTPHGSCHGPSRSSRSSRVAVVAVAGRGRPRRAPRALRVRHGAPRPARRARRAGRPRRPGGAARPSGAG